MLVHRRLVLVWRASLSTFFLSPFCVFLCFLGGVLSRTKPGVGPPPGKSEGGGGCGRWLSTDALFLLGVFWLGISPALRFFWSVSTNFFADGLAQVPRLCDKFLPSTTTTRSTTKRVTTVIRGPLYGSAAPTTSCRSVISNTHHQNIPPSFPVLPPHASYYPRGWMEPTVFSYK
jgi:hypothetical protein